ncbi:hypothetical protein MMPV_004490 [Pyropia vietnamensis]
MSRHRHIRRHPTSDDDDWDDDIGRSPPGGLALSASPDTAALYMWGASRPTVSAVAIPDDHAAVAQEQSLSDHVAEEAAVSEVTAALDGAGFSDARIRRALADAGGSVEAAIATLCEVGVTDTAVAGDGREAGADGDAGGLTLPQPGVAKAGKLTLPPPGGAKGGGGLTLPAPGGRGAGLVLPRPGGPRLSLPHPAASRDARDRGADTIATARGGLSRLLLESEDEDGGGVDNQDLNDVCDGDGNGDVDDDAPMPTMFVMSPMASKPAPAPAMPPPLSSLSAVAPPPRPVATAAPTGSRPRKSQAGAAGTAAGSSGVTTPQRPKKAQAAVDVAPLPTTTTLPVLLTGHVDAGKSTLIGALLRAVHPPPPSHRAPPPATWETDTDAVEQTRGVTIDLAARSVTSPHPPAHRTYVFIDSPGHVDFVPAVIAAAAAAVVAVVVVDAGPGAAEAGLGGGGVDEQLLLARAAGVRRLVVAVNKMDAVDWDGRRWAEVVASVGVAAKRVGYRPAEVTYVPVAAGAGGGVNLVSADRSALPSWYDGGSLLNALDALPPFEELLSTVGGRGPPKASPLTIGVSPHKVPTRLLLLDATRTPGAITVTGSLLSGTLTAGDTLTASPTPTVVKVRGVEPALAFAGIHSVVTGGGGGGDGGGGGGGDAEGGGGGTDAAAAVAPGLGPGTVLCDPSAVLRGSLRLRVRLLIPVGTGTMLPGERVVAYVGGWGVEAVMESFVELLGGSASAPRAAVTTGATVAPVASSQPGGVAKPRRPRTLRGGDRAVVVVRAARRVPAEVGGRLGRVVLRGRYGTVGVGVVERLLRDVQRARGGGGKEGGV